MSGAISLGGFPGLGAAIAAANNTESTIGSLTTESSTGYLAPYYDGLGENAYRALDLTSSIANNTAQSAALDQSATYLSVQQTALSHIQSIVGSFTQQLTLLQTTGIPINGLASSAQNTLIDLANTLDTKSGDTYVFAGQDSQNPPVPNPNAITSSAFYTAVANAVAGLAANGQPAVSAQTLAASAAGPTSPYSTTLEASNLQAQTSLNSDNAVPIGMLADQTSPALAGAIGTTSTGSALRDMFRGLATIASLTNAQTTLPGYGALLSDTLASMNNANTALTSDIAQVGGQQDLITATQSDQTNIIAAFQTQLSSLQDADLPQVATALSAAQTQLQASYQVIAQISQLSLAKYLPT